MHPTSTIHLLPITQCFSSNHHHFEACTRAHTWTHTHALTHSLTHARSPHHPLNTQSQSQALDLRQQILTVVILDPSHTETWETEGLSCQFNSEECVCVCVFVCVLQCRQIVLPHTVKKVYGNKNWHFVVFFFFITSSVTVLMSHILVKYGL